jgi:hypothetical protein
MNYLADTNILLEILLNQSITESNYTIWILMMLTGLLSLSNLS